MDRKITAFTRLLRENGLRVSIAEELDAFRSLQCVGLAERDVTRAALRSAMVKRPADIPTYDELFDLFFSGLGAVIREATLATREALSLAEGDIDLVMEQIGELLRDADLDLSELALALLRDDRVTLQRMLEEAARRSHVAEIRQAFQEGRYSHQMAEHLGLGRVSAELEALESALTGRGIPRATAEMLARFLHRRRRDLADMLKRTVRLELQKHDASLRKSARVQALAEKSFYYLSEAEIQCMKEAVAKLARRLRNVVVIRRRRAKRGKFDIKRTLRQNLQFGGVPFRVRFDRRVRDKPKVVVLCDVSDSVRNVSRFMLQFVYSLQDLYSRVRSYIFVSEVGEITRLFEENEINRALDMALAGDIINVYTHSDFGRAFRIFRRDHLRAVDKRTTVIILGDGRNNYNAPHEWVLKTIRSRAKQLIWLNPESRLTWGFGDSEMDRYGLFCDVVEECRNLNQLYRVVDRLVR